MVRTPSLDHDRQNVRPRQNRSHLHLLPGTDPPAIDFNDLVAFPDAQFCLVGIRFHVVYTDGLTKIGSPTVDDKAITKAKTTFMNGPANATRILDHGETGGRILDHGLVATATTP